MTFTLPLGVERLTRSFSRVISKTSERPRAAPDQVLPEATIRWGKPSNLGSEQFEPNQGEGTFGFVTAEPEVPPLWGTYDEEARLWESIRIENPEDSEQFVVIPRVKTLALKGRDQAWPSLSQIGGDVIERPEQYQIGFMNAYTVGDPLPTYLVNASGESFEPIVVDPLTTIMEVGWPGQSFVLISIQIKPRKSVEFEADVEEPVGTQIHIPDNGFGDQEDEQGQTPEGLTPFMEVWQEGSVVDEENGGPDSKEGGQWYPLGVENSEISPPITSTILFDNVSPSTFETKGGVLVKIPIDNQFEEWVQAHKFAAGSYCAQLGVVSEQFYLLSEPRPGGSGCYYPFVYKEWISQTPQTKPDSPYFISVPPAAGAIFTDPDGQEFQWRLDADHVHQAKIFSNSANGGMSVNGAFQFTVPEPFPSTYNGSYIYRKWTNGGVTKYDANPFVYYLLMVDVALIKKIYQQLIISQETGVEFSISAGEADDPSSGNNQLEPSDFGQQSGRIRWVWFKGGKPVREAAERLKDMNLSIAPGEEPIDEEVEGESSGEDIHVPTYDEVWAALRDGTGYLNASDVATLQDAIVNEEEGSFPQGASIEGNVSKAVTYLVNYAEKNLIER